MNEIIKSLYDRKSVRVFEDRPIPADMKETILETAAQAPSAGCQQLYTIIDVTDQAIKDTLADFVTISLLSQRQIWWRYFVQIVRNGMMPI